MTSNRYRNRLDALFADLDRLSANPVGDAAAVRREIEELRARMTDLEADIAKSAKRAAARKKPSSAGSTPLVEQPAVPAAVELPPSPRRAAPGVYATERVGYAYAGDSVQPLRGPESDAPSEGVKVPLTASGQVIGNVQARPPSEREWTAEEMSLLNAVARQASVQIENLRLLDATERARAEAESATRRFMHENWDSYLDGIRHSERVGYAYDQSSVSPFFDPPASDGGIQATVNVMEEQVGMIHLQPDPSRPVTNEDRAMVASVAKQVAQQVENIRLLADASRARAEAEEATRRLTHENWQAYSSSKERGSLGFVYDSNQVTPLNETSQNLEVDFAQPLMVRGETIGQLSISGWKEIPPEAAELAGAIAERVSIHLETLRLAEDLAKRAAQIEASEIRFRAVTDTANDAIITADGRGNIVYFNHEAQNIFGYSNEEVLGNSLGLIMPERFRDLHHNGLNRYLNTGEAHVIGQTVELVGKRKSGEEFPIDLSLASWKTDEGAFFTALIRDITERKKIENALSKRAAELQTVAKVSATASTVLDPDELLQSVVDLTKERFNLYHAHIYLANDAWSTLLLAAGAGEIGRKLVAEEDAIPFDAEYSLVARAVRERTAVIVNDVSAHAGFLPNPLLPNTKSEMAVPMIVGEHVLGVFDVQSEQLGYFTEEEANIFTTLAAQAGIALQNARLYAEQAATLAQLRELDRLKSSFLANMSHELRTPLNSILGFADVMLEELDGPLTPNMDNDLKLIQKNGQHLLHLINDVLDMAKIEAGRMNLNPEKFRVHDLLEDVTSITSTLASEKNLSLFIEKKSDPNAELFADRTRLRQVMINLVNNAMKFTEQGKISLHVERRGENILIRVRDTGIGIPPDKLEAVFQEFTQVDTSTTRKAGGTGLGLPISRRLVEMHGGRLWAESTGVNGEGATFFVELPIEARIVDPIEIEKVQK